MGFQADRDVERLDQIQHRRKKVVLNRVIPAVAAGDEGDPQRLQHQCLRNLPLELLEMVLR